MLFFKPGPGSILGPSGNVGGGALPPLPPVIDMSTVWIWNKADRLVDYDENFRVNAWGDVAETGRSWVQPEDPNYRPVLTIEDGKPAVLFNGVDSGVARFLLSDTDWLVTPKAIHLYMVVKFPNAMPNLRVMLQGGLDGARKRWGIRLFESANMPANTWGHHRTGNTNLSTSWMRNSTALDPDTWYILEARHINSALNYMGANGSLQSKTLALTINDPEQWIFGAGSSGGASPSNFLCKEMIFLSSIAADPEAILNYLSQEHGIPLS